MISFTLAWNGNEQMIILALISTNSYIYIRELAPFPHSHGCTFPDHTKETIFSARVSQTLTYTHTHGNTCHPKIRTTTTTTMTILFMTTFSNLPTDLGPHIVTCHKFRKAVNTTCRLVAHTYTYIHTRQNRKYRVWLSNNN